MADERENKNQIFGGAQGGQIQAIDRVKAELGLDIPVETVPLPSNGKVYAVDSSLHGRETVEIKGMTSREEDILTSQALIKNGTVITELIKSCLIDKNIVVSDMIAGDRNALMVAIRITGYGPEYKMDFECPSCGVHDPEMEFRLDQLGIKRLQIEPVSVGKNEFEFVLPLCKKTVHFKFITGKDEEEIMLQQQRMKKFQATGENLVTTRLKYAIVSIEGKEDKNLIGQFVTKMPARDSLALRKFIEKNEPGIDMTHPFTCSSCQYSGEVSVPLGVNFFWPQS